MTTRKDITGMECGKLTVLEFYGTKSKSNRNALWKCECKCGNILILSLAKLLRDRKFPDKLACKDCFKKNLTTQNNAYNIWYRFKTRSNLPVYEQWKDDFNCFIQDVGERPGKARLKLKDRKNGYFPNNCFWEEVKKVKNDLTK